VRWKRGRVSGQLIALYVCLVILCFIVAAGRSPSPFEPEARPVFGEDDPPDDVPTPGPSVSGPASLLYVFLPSTNFYRSVLSYGLPGLADDHGDAESMWDTLEELIHVLTDVRLSEPFSYIRATYPMLALVVPPGPGTHPSYVMHLPEAPPEPEQVEEDTEDDPPDDPEKRPDPGAELWLGMKEPRVIIYHTHTQESYWDAVREATGMADPGEPFVANDEYNVLRVGDEMARALQEEYGVGVIHVQEYFDTMPDGTGMNRVGAYARSKDKIAALLQEYPSVSVVLDVHRDATPREITAFESDSGETWARVMIVLGTDTHLDHPEWRKNREFAEDMAEVMEEHYPGLHLRTMKFDYRYNQHLSPGALLLEVGGVENALDEALKSARMLAHVIAVLLNEDRTP